MGERTMTAMLAATLLLAATSVPAQDAGAGATRVGIDKYRFEPRVIRVRPGTVVEWVNDEKRTSHSVLFDGQPESERLFPGDTYRKTFATPGTYPYRCGPHPDMTGIVEVVP